MKHALYIIACINCSIFGCDSFLNEYPDGRVEPKSLEDVAKLLNLAYSDASPLFLEFKTDNVVAMPLNTQVDYLTRNFQYKPILQNNEMTPNYFWERTYNAIAHSNQALEYLEKLPNSNNKLRNALMGEALITRAYNHFMLANVFCQHYEKDYAESELGIPYVTAPENKLLKNYDRGNLKITYDKIEKDMLKAIPLLSSDFYPGSKKYHFSKISAFAFASRYYLFKGDWHKCIQYADSVLGKGVPSRKNFRNMAKVFSGTKFLNIAKQFYDVSLHSNLLVSKKYIGIGLDISKGYQTTQLQVELVIDKDTNIQQADDNRFLLFGLLDLESWTIPKIASEYHYSNNKMRAFYIATPFRTEEVFFNRFEAYSRIKKFDKAIADYNAYAPTRYITGGKRNSRKNGLLDKDYIHLTYLGKTMEDSFIKFVIRERRKEFFKEYLRWFDIKRFKMKVKHTDVNGDVFILKENDLRKAVQIPPYAIAQGVVPNPR